MMPYNQPWSSLQLKAMQTFSPHSLLQPRGLSAPAAAKSAGSRQCTAAPQRAGRPYLPSQVTGAA
jgi:hypothetical protein